MLSLKTLEEKILGVFGVQCNCGNASFLGYLCDPETGSAFPNGGVNQTNRAFLCCRLSDYNPTAGDSVTVDGVTFTVVPDSGALYRFVSPARLLIYIKLKG